jgi:hypothetical protein
MRRHDARARAGKRSARTHVHVSGWSRGHALPGGKAMSRVTSADVTSREAPAPSRVKACSRCKQELSAGSFPKSSSAKDGLRHFCRECGAKSFKEWYAKNRGRNTERCGKWRAGNPGAARAYLMKSEYGITLLHYLAAVHFQGYCCAICRCRVSIDPGAKQIAVDHCHRTGKVRGILCSDCNLSIGKFNDCAVTLQSAARYVRAGGWC